MLELFSMDTATCVMALVATFLILFLFWHIKTKYFSSEQGRVNRGNALGKPHAAHIGHCPVCKTPLENENSIRTKVFNFSDKSRTTYLCYIYGCPSCYPKCSENIERRCPVCRKVVSENDYLLARMFTKTRSGKPHVIINGCGNCNRNYHSEENASD